MDREGDAAVNFFTKMTLGAAAVLLAAVAAILLFRSREAGRVEDLLREAVGWARAGDADRCGALIAPDFDDGGYDAAAARNEIRRRVRPGAFAKLEVAGLEVRVDGIHARARLELDVQPADAPIRVTMREVLRLTLRKAGDEWKITGAHREERRPR